VQLDVRPTVLPGTRGRLEDALDRLARSLDERTRRRLVTDADLAPRLTPAKAAAYALAAVVHLVTVGAVAGAIALAAATFPNPASLFVAAAMVGFAWLVRPRFGEEPKTGVVDRDRAPGIYRLVDEVAAALNTRTADLIVLDPRLNAHWSVVGLRRRRVLTLGMPLLAALTPPERIALIAHEVAHGRNGDTRKGLIVGPALRTLMLVYTTLLELYGGFASFFLGARFVFLGLAQPVKWLTLLEFRLLMRDMQRAEYLADHLGATVGGTTAMIAVHEKLLLETTIRMVVHETVHRRLEPDALLAAIADRAANVPTRERERVRRVAELEGARLDETHPPTAMRIRALEERPPLPPRIVLAERDAFELDGQLLPYREALAKQLVEDYRDSLYR